MSAAATWYQKRDLPVHPFTDAELVEYMENKGLGTVASRTSIIRTLLTVTYIRYAGKYIVPTPKGMFTYETIRGKEIADTELTGTGKPCWQEWKRGRRKNRLPERDKKLSPP